MSTTIYRRVVYITICQSMSINLYRRVVHKNKYLCFENRFSIHGKCMCERVVEDSRHGTWHVDIRVGMCIILLECVCLSLHEHLGGK